MFRIIREAYIFKLYLAMNDIQVYGIRFFLYVRFCIKRFKYSIRCSQ